MLPDLKILFDGPDDVKSVGSSASNQERHFLKKDIDSCGHYCKALPMSAKYDSATLVTIKFASGVVIYNRKPFILTIAAKYTEIVSKGTSL